MLKITDLVKKYDQKEIGPFNIEVQQNQTVGIIGKSGAGKTTFIKMITNVVVQNEGEITYNNKKLKKDQFIYISQIGTLFNHLTIKDNIQLTYKGNDDEILKVLQELNLDSSYLDKYPFELSGGRSKRIDLARAIIAKKKIIILDEALSSLDASTKDDIYDILKILRKKHQLIILIITHDLDEALYLCDTIILLEAGKIKFNDNSLNLLKQKHLAIDELINPKRLERLKKVYLNE